MNNTKRTLGAAALFVLFSLGALPAAAEATPPAPPAPLVIGGRTVVTFRATIGGYTPADRAQGARLRLIADYERNPRLTLTARHVAEGSQVLADGKTMFLIAPDDVNAPGGETPEAAADRAIETMRRIIGERDERRDPVAIAKAVGWAALASLVALLLLRLVIALDQRLGTVFSRRVAEAVAEVQVSGVSMFDRSHMLRLARKLVRGFAWVLAAIIVYLWLNAVLELIPFTRPWGERLTRALLDVLATIGTAILDALPGLILVVFIVALARLATEVTDLFFDQVIERNVRVGWLDRHSAKPTKILVRLLVWIFALAMAYPYLPGADSRAFQGLSVLVGLMISFGASSIVGQAAAGLILMYTSTFRVGEYVRVQESEGTITEMGIFATRLRTGMGDEIVLPNSLVLACTTRNYSRVGVEPGFVVGAKLTIGYDTPWRQVHAMLVEAAQRTEGVLAEPAPRVFQTDLSDFYAEYQLAAVCGIAEPYARARVVSALNANIQDVFNENEVQIMSPHYFADPERPKVVPKSKWFPS
jgi:small-conductance mechanosensitive channel